MSVRLKFILISFLSVASLATVLVWFGVYKFKDEISTLNEKLYTERIERFVQIAKKEDELAFEGVYKTEDEPKEVVLDKLRTVHRELKGAPNYPYLFDEANNLLSHPSLPRGDKSFASSDFVKTMRETKKGELVHMLDGNQVYSRYEIFEPWNWLFVYSLPIAMRDKAIDSYINFEVTFALASVLVLCVFIYFYTQMSISTPLKSLVDYADSVRRSLVDSDSNSKPDASLIARAMKSKDEIGTLGRNFNLMIDEIHRHTAELSQLVESGREVASQVSLHGLSDKVVQVCTAFAGDKVSTEVFYSDECFVNEDIAKGFYLVEKSGTLGTVAQDRAKIESTHDVCVPVVDARSMAVLGIVALKASPGSSLEKSVPALQALSNSVASAITTVRLEKTFFILDRKTREIQTIFSNITQGICMIDSKLRIYPEYSSHLESILEESALENRSLADLLLSRSSVKGDIATQVENCVFVIVDEHILSFETNATALPREIDLISDGKTKTLEIDWVPIVDASDTVTRLMVTLRDVTLLKQLRQQAETQKKEMEVINQIVSVTPEKFTSFIENSRNYLEDTLSKIKGRPNLSPEGITEMMRNIHTIKGNSRSVNFSYLTEVVHEVETELLDVVHALASTTGEPKERFSDELKRISSILSFYESINADKLRRDGKAARILKESLSEATRLTGELLRKGIQPDAQNMLIELHARLISLHCETLGNVVHQVEAGLASVAAEIGKPAPVIALSEKATWVLDDGVSELLTSSFTHMTRNSLDHAFSQDVQGRILFESSIENGKAVIVYSDTGRGLNLARLEQLGRERGSLGAKPSDLDIAMTIFASGVSTAESLTMISGRGVGMEAVKAMFELVGGTVAIEFTSPSRNGDFRLFRLRLSLPVGLVTVLDGTTLPHDTIRQAS